MWFHDIARDHANKNARAGTPQNQITFEMLTDARQFDTIEAQIQCPPLLHEQLKTVAIEAWDRITPQEEPTGSYTKIFRSDQIRSVAQSCPTLCNPMNRSMPGLPVHPQLPEFTQTHIHRVSDAIQPSHPLLSPSPLAPNPSQHQSLFQ